MLKFISVEGIEGVGKTTAIHFIKNYFIKLNEPFLTTREPGGTPLAELMRSILLTQDSTKDELTDQSELLLIMAARSLHVEHVILPALQNGSWVITDRFSDASFAYQGGGRQLSVEIIQLLDDWVTNGLTPGCTILLDAPPAIGLMRAKKRNASDRIEAESIAFFNRVRECYLKRARSFPKRFKIIDATQALLHVEAQITSILNELMEQV